MIAIKKILGKIMGNVEKNNGESRGKYCNT